MSIGYVEACFQLSKSKIDSRQSGSKDLNRHDSGRALACFAGIKDVRSHEITEVTLLGFSCRAIIIQGLKTISLQMK